ncbi:hypothetical protein GCM10009612_28150 [Streptomyces beijiangensis]
MTEIVTRSDHRSQEIAEISCSPGRPSAPSAAAGPPCRPRPKRAAIASARRVIAVTDSAKLSRTGLAFVAPASALHAVVTDGDASDEEVGALVAAGVTVRQV